MRRLLKSGGVASGVLSVCLAASSVSPVSRPPADSAQYRIKLGPFVVPPSRNAGLIIQARINNGPALRLLLDSGAQHIVLDRKAAAKSGCAGGMDLDLVGAGSSGPSLAKLQRAQTVQAGDLTLHDVPVVVENRSVADGIQGVMPLSIFAGFLIRLDIPHKILELLPYPTEEPVAGALRSVASNQILFVKGTINERAEGHFLLDTGASYTAISRKIARQLNLSEALADRVPLQGGTTDLDAPLLRGSIHLRFGSREVAADSVVAVDLSTASRFHGLEVAGLIGYPSLRDSVVTVSYRDSFIRIDPQ